MANRWMLLSWWETTKHKALVAWYLLKVCRALMRRAIVHDLSKYGPNEAPYFGKVVSLAWGTTYGSKEYKQQTREILQPALEHHYANNSHHPEHWGGHVEAMGLLDLIEMLCDWKAATKRHADGDMFRSLEYNQGRFGYNGALFGLLHEAALEIGLLREEYPFQEG